MSKIEELLNLRSNTFQAKDDLFVSFKDCPNRCIDGYIIDPYTHKKTICAYCRDKRKTALRDNLVSSDNQKSIEDILNLPKSFTGVDFNIDTIIPESEKKLLEQESYLSVIKELKELSKMVKSGNLPNHSYMFNLGKKVYEGNYIYSLLASSYIAGLTTCPLVSAYDIVNIRNLAENGMADLELSLSYKDLLTKQLLVVDIEAGATTNSILVVKGVMQLRARKELATVIFTNQWGSIVTDLVGEDSTYNLATLYSVEYKSKKTTSSDTSKLESVLSRGNVSMTSEQFRNLMK